RRGVPSLCARTDSGGLTRSSPCRLTPGSVGSRKSQRTFDVTCALWFRDSDARDRAPELKVVSIGHHSMQLLLIHCGVGLALIGSLSGCSQDLERAPCPCLAGWECCAARKICVRAGETCRSDPSDNDADKTDVSLDRNLLSSYVGNWDGYVEGYAFPTGSPRLRVTLDESGSGTVFIGDRQPLPLPTNPDVGYPETAFEGDPSLQRGLFEGILYPIQSAHTLDDQLHFFVDAHAAFSTWCTLQTPDPADGYLCVPVLKATYSTNGTFCSYEIPPSPPVQVDCNKLTLCVRWHVCVCDADACKATTGLSVSVNARFQTSIDKLEGTILLPQDVNSTEPYALHLVRSVSAPPPVPEAP